MSTALMPAFPVPRATHWSEPALGLLRLDPGEADDLVARAVARDDRRRPAAGARASSASRLTTASFARPPSGGAATRTFHAVAVAADDPGARGAGRDAQLQSGRRRHDRSLRRRRL